MADITTTRQFVDGERGITAQKLNDIVGSSTIQPAFYSSKPTAPSADPADIALILKAGAYAQVPISSLAGSATQAQIWDTRLRSYNSVGNPNFEVNQRVYPAVAASPPVGGSMTVDRWGVLKNGLSTGVASCGQGQYGSGIQIPGTSYSISWASLLLTLTAQQATLAPGDLIWFNQSVESIMLRELISDVHSISILARSSVANLKFGVAIRDGAGTPTRSLTKLCSMGAANTWTLIQLPNLPVWPSAVTWPIGSGGVGYQLAITLASGSTFMSPANDTWQTGSFIGAVGQSNFAASPVNSTFELAFVQHEPGSICTTLMDKPFSQNLDECLRYYCKSYPYGTSATTTGMGGYSTAKGSNGQFVITNVRWPKVMAKGPNVVVYDTTTGGVNNIRNFTAGTTMAGTAGDVTETGFSFLNIPSGYTANQDCMFHYTAETGW